MGSKWLLAAIFLAACTRGNPGLSIVGDDLAVPADLGGAGTPDLAVPHDLARASDLARATDLAGRDFAGVDLASSDLATPADLSAVPDLASVPDLAGAPDLATVLDLAGVSCVPSSNAATIYVDPILGSDDATHGGAPGPCANKTLTYALGHATGTISLATAVYTAPAETLPFTLTGSQHLLCHAATLRGAGGTAKATVIMDGDQDTLDQCIVDGTGSGVISGVICVYAQSAAATSHTITGCTVTRCGGTGIYVGQGPTNISGSTITNVATDGILWYAASGTMTNNNFSGNTRDIDCPGSSSGGITGSGNTRAGGSPVCVGCAHCSF